MKTKIMIYMGEKQEFMGYKKVAVDIPVGSKVLVNGKFAKCMSVNELTDEGFLLLKGVFGEVKKKRISVADKTREMVECLEYLTDERIVSSYYEKLMRKLERREEVLDYVVENM